MVAATLLFATLLLMQVALRPFAGVVLNNLQVAALMSLTVTQAVPIVVSSFFVANLFQGLIWFLLPVTLVICNDIMAFFSGFFMGRTPLLKISPKKTWEALCNFLEAWSTCPSNRIIPRTRVKTRKCDVKPVVVEEEHPPTPPPLPSTELSVRVRRPLPSTARRVDGV